MSSSSKWHDKLRSSQMKKIKYKTCLDILLLSTECPVQKIAYLEEDICYKNLSEQIIYLKKLIT